MPLPTSQPLRSIAMLALVLATYACQAAPPVPAPEGTVTETRVSVRIGAHAYRLLGPDGHLLGDFSVMVNGKVFHAAGGKLELPAGDVAAAAGAGGVVLLVKGYAPYVLDPSHADGDLVLSPIARGSSLVTGTLALNTLATSLAAPSNVAFLKLPPGFVTHAGTAVSVATYTPPLGPADLAAFTQQRQALLAKVPNSDPTCKSALPCAPGDASLGLELVVDGAVGTGKLTASYDLAALAAGTPEQAAAAQQIRAAFAAIDASGNPAYREQLAAQDGIQLVGDTLTFDVPLDTQPNVDGVSRVDVTGFEALGLKLEVTIVSALGGHLPDEAVAPGQLTTTAAAGLPDLGIAGAAGVLSNNGSQAPSLDVLAGAAAGVLSNNASQVVSNNGSKVVSNQGGAITGTIRAPFAPDAVKYTLSAFASWPWPKALVEIADANDASYGTVTANAQGLYQITQLPDTPATLFLVSPVDGGSLRAIGHAPASGVSLMPADAATTGVTAFALDKVRAGAATIDQIDLAGYARDVAALRGLLDQDTARTVVQSTVAGAAAHTSALFAANGYTPASFAAVPSPIPSAPGDGVPVVQGISPAILKPGDEFTLAGHGFGAVAGHIEYVATDGNSGTLGAHTWSDTAISFKDAGPLASVAHGATVTFYVRLPDGTLALGGVLAVVPSVGG